MSKLYVQLGRTGDICGILPLLYSDFKKTGEKQRLMVAKEFAGVLDGVSYVEPIIWEGHYNQLEEAAKLADTMSKEVIVTQVNAHAVGTETYLASIAVEKTQDFIVVPKREARAMTGAVTDAHNKEQWQLAGRIDDWEECLPLVFDKRSPEREAKLLRDVGITHKRGKKKPLMLVSAGGASSPFPYKDLLMELLYGRFHDHYRILELPNCERIYDLLALYEHADLLIATDSAPLHLAWAVRELPVFALTQDRASNGSYSLWHGSAWRPNHLWYCRYHDFPKRAVQMLDAMGKMWGTPLKDGETIHVWNDFEPRKTNFSHRSFLPILKGSCGRDSYSVLQDQKRSPFLKDAIKMAMQRAESDGTVVELSRPQSVRDGMWTDKTPSYAYRIQNGEFRPVVDLFCATKHWWRTILPEIPDLILNNDHYWSEVLWAIFKSHGASDATGACSFVKDAA